MKIPKGEGKTRFRIYGKERFEEVLAICKERIPNLERQFEKVLKDKNCTQAELNLAETII